jgi:lactate dehydrogenase-like 2-hydroxyacid dehydrogenase
MERKYKKVVVLDTLIFYPEHKKTLNRIAGQIVEYNTCKNKKEVLERVRDADCIISCWVDIPNQVIDENPQLKTIAFWTHAYEHRIDKEYALKHNIYVPSIPDYGTDSVAELVFIGLLQLCSMKCDETKTYRGLTEEIIAKISDDVRKFNRNRRDALRGSWIHEYIKVGNLKITNQEEIKEETLKGLTMGVVVDDNLEKYVEDLFKISGLGFRMNIIYSLRDLPHGLYFTYRPIEKLLEESQVIVYDSKNVDKKIINKIYGTDYLSKVDVSKIVPRGESLMEKRIGIIGLGRIGARVAQIARDGFNMDVSYFSKKRRIDFEKRYNLHFKPLHKILKENDIVTFHLPHIGAERFITKKMIDMIPAGTIVVNTSVGNIFEDQTYILNRFREGDLRGYFDVYETLPPRKELRRR